jgi:hypothetical protein
MTKLTIEQELGAIDKRDYKWYSSLTDDERAKFNKGMFVIMRWCSAVSTSNRDISDHYLVMTNELVNRHFNVVRNNPELQHRLLQIVGIGAAQRHQWIRPLNGTKLHKGVNPKLFKLYREHNASLSDDEICIVLSNSTKEEKVEFLESHGFAAKQCKAYLK